MSHASSACCTGPCEGPGISRSHQSWTRSQVTSTSARSPTARESTRVAAVPEVTYLLRNITLQL